MSKDTLLVLAVAAAAVFAVYKVTRTAQTPAKIFGVDTLLDQGTKGGIVWGDAVKKEILSTPFDPIGIAYGDISPTFGIPNSLGYNQ